MKNHFLYFTKAERFGIISLLLICLALWVIPACIPDGQKEEVIPKPNDLSDWAEASTDSVMHDAGSPILTSFNPNEVDADQLLEMGLPQRTARSWQNYLNKGGQFRNIDDLKKFRALSSADLERIEAYLVFSTPPQSRVRSKTATRERAPVLTPFDPNKQSRFELSAMGLSPKAAKSWENYLKAGGQFHKPGDIRKVYGLSEADYQRLLPFLRFPEQKEEWTSREAISEATLPSSYEEARKNTRIDVNRATAEEWQQLRGIGPAYSRRIVKFRDKLGGFHNLEQIRETYGLPDSVYQAIYLHLQHSPIFRSLSINRATIEQLAEHPYLNYQHARLIVRYREEHGPFQAAEDLKELYGLESGLLEKMAPYWDFKE